MHRILRLTITAAAAGLLAGCQAGADLEPAASAATAGVEGEAAAVANISGVQVTALAPAFPGSVEISRAVTPMKVRIDNNGPVPVRLRYDAFSLVGADGTTYRALPLYRIDKTVQEAVRVADAAPIAAPGFGYRDFAVAPYYGPLYPTVTPFAGPFDFPPAAYDLYDTAFVDVELPTPAMRNNVLPEGVIAPGGYVEGWLYFQKVAEGAERVTFRADLVNANAGQSLGVATIPYTVEG